MMLLALAFWYSPLAAIGSDSVLSARRPCWFCDFMNGFCCRDQRLSSGELPQQQRPPRPWLSCSSEQACRQGKTSSLIWLYTPSVSCAHHSSCYCGRSQRGTFLWLRVRLPSVHWLTRFHALLGCIFVDWAARPWAQYQTRPTVLPALWIKPFFGMIRWRY